MTDTNEPPQREEFEHDPIDHVRVRTGMTVDELVQQYGQIGFTAGKLENAVEIYAEMIDRGDVTNFFALAGSMVPGGMRRLVTDLIRDGHIDVLVTTGANLTHDAIEAIGGAHHHGHEPPRNNNGELDGRLREEGIDRLYDVYLPQEHFTDLEQHLRGEVLPAIDRPISIQRFIEELGRANGEVNDHEGIAKDPGIAAAAFEHDVPVYCPAIQDSVLGLQAWMYSQISDFELLALSDMTSLNDIAHEATRAGAMLVGGGVPKNYVLQTLLVAPKAYDYAVQLTMDPVETGGLSGATLEEAVSWGKLETDSQYVSIYADVTMTLPLLIAAARERIA